MICWSYLHLVLNVWGMNTVWCDSPLLTHGMHSTRCCVRFKSVLKLWRFQVIRGCVWEEDGLHIGILIYGELTNRLYVSLVCFISAIPSMESFREDCFNNVIHRERRTNAFCLFALICLWCSVTKWSMEIKKH